MRSLVKMINLNEELTPHSLRHTHAKVGLEDIMERLGHSEDDTTRKVYLHVTKI
ncbi:tyrosine-type recombinase/integrase [Cytobacillus sp. FSL M8-0252]|uniref:tyrosine-type recombinase/integrase n=1 Tax=Cytobacillus sp. FSL M8-0252 TaxID=2921621 RepID=UPI0030F91689